MWYLAHYEWPNSSGSFTTLYEKATSTLLHCYQRTIPEFCFRASTFSLKSQSVRKLFAATTSSHPLSAKILQENLTALLLKSFPCELKTTADLSD